MGDAANISENNLGESDAGGNVIDGSSSGGGSGTGVGRSCASGTGAGRSGAGRSRSGGNGVDESRAVGSGASGPGVGGNSGVDGSYSGGGSGTGVGRSGASGTGAGGSGAGRSGAARSRSDGNGADESRAGGSGAGENSASGRKRSFRSIAENCMALENDFLVCKIEENSGCPYKQKPQRFDCGNFIRHLRGEHAELARARGLFKDEDDGQNSPPVRRRRIPRVGVAIDQQTVVEAVVRMTGVEHMPINNIESKGLKMLLDPICDSLGMKVNSEHAVAHLNVCSEHIKMKIREEVNGKLLSLKIDSASRHRRHILGINVQFWDGREVVIRTLAMLEVNERQTAKFITLKIEEVLKEYNIALDQVLTVTCDNGANMLAAVRELDKHVQILRADSLTLDDDDNFEDNDELLNDLINELSTKVSLVRCAVHTLQLAVTDVIKHTDIRIRSITTVAKNCRKTAYKPSFDLKNIPLPPLYSHTRWGGIYEMILNLNDNEEFYRDLGKQFEELDLSDYWEYIHEYKNAMQPVYVATKEMQAKHMSLGDFYIHWLRCLMEVKQQPTNNLAKSLATSLQTRLHQLQQNLAFKAALLIDPRFNYISSSVLTSEEKEQTRNFIIATSARLQSLKPSKTPQGPIQTTGQTTSSLDDFITGLFGGPPPSTSTSHGDTLVKQVNALDLETHQNYKFDTWKHWTDRKETHPELSEVALTILSVPATQVSVERAFSALALVLSPARTKLSAVNLANILLVKINEDLLPKVIPNMYDWKNMQGLNALSN